MSDANRFQLGTWNIHCAVCTRKVKRSDCRTDWKNRVVCQRCYDPKHPNDYPRPVIYEDVSVPDGRQRATVYLELGGITKWSDTTIRWDDLYLRWDDDPSNNELFYNGNP